MTPDLSLGSRVDAARQTYRFRTADGLHAADSFRDSELLLLDALWDADPGRLLCVEANYGVVGTVLAATASTVEMTESSARAARFCRRNAARNDADAAVSLVADLSDLPGSYDTAAYAPKPYTPLAVGTQRAVDALAALRPGGDLSLAATEQSGVARYEQALREVADDVTAVTERDGCRLLRATRPETMDRPQHVTCRTVEATVDGVALSLRSVPGLFSASRLDAGTRLLLETASVPDGATVLDLCCGYGAVGAYAASIADCDVWLTDDDRVATACAERSLDATGVSGTVVTADCTAGVADQSFDQVLCNPPTHAGAGVLEALFAGAHDVLAPDGTLLLVHHGDLDLSSHLGRFDAVERRRTGPAHVVVSAGR